MPPFFTEGRRIAKLPLQRGNKTHLKAVIFIYPGISRGNFLVTPITIGVALCGQ
jgi:hypothetical protein